MSTTPDPVSVHYEWSAIKSGSFTGKVKNLSAGTVVIRITADVDGSPVEPDAGAGGISVVGNTPVDVVIGATETLFARVPAVGFSAPARVIVY